MKRSGLIWPMGMHSAFTRAGAMGRRESALMVLTACLRSRGAICLHAGAVVVMFPLVDC